MMSNKEKNDILKGLGRYPPGNLHKWHPKGFQIFYILTKGITKGPLNRGGGGLY